MGQSTQTISVLRHRMIEDMRMRKLSPKTQSSYIRACGSLRNTSAARPTPPPLRICAAISCTWSIRASRRFRSMRRSPD